MTETEAGTGRAYQYTEKALEHSRVEGFWQGYEKHRRITVDNARINAMITLIMVLVLVVISGMYAVRFGYRDGYREGLRVGATVPHLMGGR